MAHPRLAHIATTDLPNRTVAEALVQRRIGPGVLMFNEDLELIYVNQEALEYNHFLLQKRAQGEGQSLLAPEIMRVSEELSDYARRNRDPKFWERFQLRRTVGIFPDILVLYGIGMPTLGTLLMFMEPFTTQQKTQVGIGLDWNLSERERAVLTCLALGMTNKEIAKKLQLSEHTVKDHIKRIMKKTGSTTRTGVLAQVGLTGAVRMEKENLPLPIKETKREHQLAG